MHKGKQPIVAVQQKKNREFLKNHPQAEKPEPVVQKQRWFWPNMVGDVGISTVGARVYLTRNPVNVKVIGVRIFIGSMKVPEGDTVVVEALVNGIPTISLPIGEGGNDITSSMTVSLKADDRLELVLKKWLREEGSGDPIRANDVTATVSFEKE